MRFRKKLFLEMAYLLWMGLLPFISSLALGYFAVSNPSFFLDFSLSQQILFWLATVFVMGLALCPTTFLALFVGYIWGFQGIWPLIFAYSLASMLGFGMAKLWKGQAMIRWIKRTKKGAQFLSNVQAQSFSWVFLARLSPIFPFAITNAMMSFLGVSFLDFCLAGMIGMLPRTALAVWTGTQAKSWEYLLHHPESFTWQDGASVVLLVFSGLGMYFLAKRQVKA